MSKATKILIGTLVASVLIGVALVANLALVS